jgi:PEP-CTERM motif
MSSRCRRRRFMTEHIRWVTWAVALLALLGVASAAHATALPAPSVDVAVPNLATFTGTSVVADTGNLSYSAGGATGTVREWVVANGTGALCAGCLSFVYQFTVTAGSIGRLSASSYDAFTVDVSHSLNLSPLLVGSINGGFGPQNADRDATGATIDFDFNPAVTTSSSLLIANTNATASQSGIMFLNSATGASSANIAGFVPGQPTVPEPATLLLIGSGVVALGVWRRRS